MSQRCSECAHWDRASAVSGQKSDRVVNAYRVAACKWPLPPMPVVATSVEIRVDGPRFMAACYGDRCPVFKQRVKP